MVRLGSARQAHLETGIPESTLKYWRNQSYTERYAEIAGQWASNTYQSLAARHEEIALSALDKQRDLVEAIDVEAIPPEKRPDASYKLAITAGVHQDKARAARDLPVEVHEHRDAAELLRSLERRVPKGLAHVDSTAEEVTDAEEVTPEELPTGD